MKRGIRGEDLRKEEDVGVMKVKEVKLEETGKSLTHQVDQGKVMFRGERGKGRGVDAPCAIRDA